MSSIIAYKHFENPTRKVCRYFLSVNVYAQFIEFRCEIKFFVGSSLFLKFTIVQLDFIFRLEIPFSKTGNSTTVFRKFGDFASKILRWSVRSLIFYTGHGPRWFRSHSSFATTLTLHLIFSGPRLRNPRGARALGDPIGQRTTSVVRRCHVDLREIHFSLLSPRRRGTDDSKSLDDNYHRAPYRFAWTPRLLLITYFRKNKRIQLH